MGVSQGFKRTLSLSLILLRSSAGGSGSGVFRSVLRMAIDQLFCHENEQVSLWKHGVDGYTPNFVLVPSKERLDVFRAHGKCLGLQFLLHGAVPMVSRFTFLALIIGESIFQLTSQAVQALDKPTYTLLEPWFDLPINTPGSFSSSSDLGQYCLTILETQPSMIRYRSSDERNLWTTKIFSAVFFGTSVNIIGLPEWKALADGFNQAGGSHMSLIEVNINAISVTSH